MLDYIYYAAAVIVLAGIAILAAALLRRRARRARHALEGMTYVDPAEAFDRAGSAGPADGAGSAAGAGDVFGAGPAVDASRSAEAAKQRVEQVLAGWRAEHQHASSNRDTAGRSAPAAPGAGAESTGAGPAAFAVRPPAVAPSVTPPPPAFVALSGGSGIAAALLADPLGAVIIDMAEGKGRLSVQEMKRLEVFRPDRIQMATETVQLPVSLQNDDEAVMRLAQMKLYAATLELRAKWASHMVPGPDAGVPDIPLSARDFKLKMARDIMALPASDRSEVIGFLLGGLLNAKGASPRLKQAVIDTLEHLRSAALVNVLLDCLDDPDPIIQDYALAAADRLLDD